MEKAYFVTFDVTTKVVVDIDDDCKDTDPATNDGLWDDIVSAALNIVELGGENVSYIEEDTEYPYEEEE